MAHLHKLDPGMEECISSCSDCHDSSLEAAMHAQRQSTAAEDVMVLLDCAQVCDMSRDFMLRGSSLQAKMCALCAEVCTACAEMCESHTGDQIMVSCARICHACAASCRAVAGGLGSATLAA